MKNKPLVKLVGLGMPEIKAVTAQALEALKSCKVLFVNDERVGFFRDLGVELRPVGEFGTGWGDRAMAEFTGRIIAAAKKEGTVGLAVYGHPMVYEPLGHYLVEACAKAKVDCEVLGATSSVDAILAALKLPVYAGQGLQVSDVGHFTSEPPRKSSWIFIFQACTAADVFRRTVEHALKTYPKTHLAGLVEAENWYPGKVRWIKLGELSRRVPEPPLYATLVIPPCP